MTFIVLDHLLNGLFFTVTIVAAWFAWSLIDYVRHDQEEK